MCQLVIHHEILRMRICRASSRDRLLVCGQYFIWLKVIFRIFLSELNLVLCLRLIPTVIAI